MSNFTKFRSLLQRQFNIMSNNGNTLFITEASKEDVWDTYINSFEEGTNPIFRERSEHDCQCCKQFVRYVGRVVAEVNGELVSVWDVPAGGIYEPVAKALKQLNLSKGIAGLFLHNEREIGREQTIELNPEGNITWDHFYQVVPEASYRKNGIAEEKGKAQTNKKVLQRSIKEITEDSVEIVLELITDDSIYRGIEHAQTVKLLQKLQKGYLESKDKELYLWKKAVELKEACSIRNTVIGSLLVDISNGVELEIAVKKFEDKVAPHNYKRSKSLVTEKMKEDAKKTAKDLGIEPSLLRRHATKEDIRVENVLFADHSVKPYMEDSLFDTIKTSSKKPSSVKFDKVQEIGIEKFIKDVLPTADMIELFLENSLEKNLMTLISPVHGTAPNIMKWGNNFSWTYNGDVADSLMKQQVRQKGGNVEGALRLTHSWNHDGGNSSLMDLHVFLPNHNTEIHNLKGKIHDYYGNTERVGWNNRKNFSTKGVQDVDFVEQAPVDFIPVENISFPEKCVLQEGVYTMKVHNWSLRSRNSSGGKAEIEIDGTIYTYDYSDKIFNHKEWLTLAEVTLKDGVFSIDHKYPCGEETSKEVWNLETKKFHKVDMIMNSPNHWDGEETGNKHLFFVLDNCKNPESVRGFYNEYLRQDLNKHRKVFEVLASQLKAEYSDEQLSGVGISSTLNKEVILKVTGKTSRVIKVKF